MFSDNSCLHFEDMPLDVGAVNRPAIIGVEVDGIFTSESMSWDNEVDNYCNNSGGL